VVLAGRDRDRLAELAGDRGLEHRAFGLDDPHDVRRALRDVDVLINAAGPFALTAGRLARGALAAGCHYVDINGEVDVYKKLDDLTLSARQRRVAMVCGAGHTAAASDLLLTAALEELEGRRRELDYDRELGAIRIAVSCTTNLSRGSAETLWRAIREQVTVVRESNLWHESVGRLERTFDFGDPPSNGSRDEPSDEERGRRDLRIASAANLVDTLTARLTVARKKFSAKRIESYVETGTVARLGYQLGAFLAPVVAIPWVRTLARQQMDFLPLGPTGGEIEEEKHVVLLEIEDPARTRIVDWRWETPNAYLFTAQVVLEIAKQLASDGHVGWRTPAEVFFSPAARAGGGRRRLAHLRGCRLSDRLAGKTG
jgi:short subunit dehydrogenase-like uncharacterized protein